MMMEKQKFREELGIVFDEKLVVSKVKEQKKNSAPKKKEDGKKKKEEPVSSSQWNSMFGSPNQHPFGAYKSKYATQDVVLPQEKIIRQKEVKKLYQYCTSGSIETLRLLIKLFNSSSKEAKIQYLSHI